MIEHVIKNLAQQLRDVELVMDDITIMAKILGSLPSKYNAWKTALDRIKLNQIVDNERFIKEESCIPMMINRKWNIRGYCSSKTKIFWKQKQKRTERNLMQRKKYVNAFS